MKNGHPLELDQKVLTGSPRDPSCPRSTEVLLLPVNDKKKQRMPFGGYAH